MSSDAVTHAVPVPPGYSQCIDARIRDVAGTPHNIARAECAEEYEELKRTATEQLIASRWLTAEAHELGAPPRVQASAGAAAGWLAARVAKTVRRPTLAELRRYYDMHRARFSKPERRYFEIDNFLTLAAARRQLEQLRSGVPIASTSPLHEMIERPARASYSASEQIARARIFAAPLGAPEGPIEDYGEHSVFVVTKVLAASRKPFADVRADIERTLVSQERRRALAAFVTAWRRRWIARTRCTPGYVVQRCANYRGPRRPEAPLSLD